MGLCAGVYVTSIFVGAFAFSIGFDTGVTKFWDTWNKGVRVLSTPRACEPVLTARPETMEGHPCQIRRRGVESLRAQASPYPLSLP